ncbi:small ribosomal subunit biogenesis GTPase RsgA 1, mitochondrial-like [Vicia villosa]|uniref:small ribosomal subunit biogenesis GTPase RsgA 1, mitochondrial-like n=1 Tax=Vicia villosa TaxID=3911 RepID=UPI00273C5A6C|nr:small ribosomal subunit biogenesis GTPase RsgA 1, mitochondrial-like [Vicia villosa]
MHFSQADGEVSLCGAIEMSGMNVFLRNSEMLDPPVANVDHLLVLFSLDKPKPESTGIPLTLALNKTELMDKETLDSWKARFQDWGYQPVFCSVKSRLNFDLLAFQLRDDQTTLIVGPRGVGKSSLINALRRNHRTCVTADGKNWFEPILGSKWLEDQQVPEVSTSSGRGKHTTKLEDDIKVKLDEEVDNECVLNALKEAFTAVGYSLEP